MKLKKISVFFPAYNEEKNISRTLKKAFDILPLFADEFEIIVINDGSSDKTREHLDVFLERYQNLKVINHEKNRGYGAAIKSGFCNSKYEYIFFTDSDGQFDLSELKKLTELIEGCDIAAGFRLKRKDHIHRIVNAKAYNLLIRFLFGLNVRDIDCAFKLIRRNVLDNISLESEGAFISAEFLIKSKKKGFKIKQIGVSHLPREQGKSTGNNPLVVIKSFIELFKLWKKIR